VLSEASGYPVVCQVDLFVFWTLSSLPEYENILYAVKKQLLELLYIYIEESILFLFF